MHRIGVALRRAVALAGAILIVADAIACTSSSTQTPDASSDGATGGDVAENGADSTAAATEANDTGANNTGDELADARGAQGRPCPDDAGLRPLPVCDGTNQNQVCEMSESTAVCIDGRWLQCSANGCGAGCKADAATAPPEGSPCCPNDYTEFFLGCSPNSGTACCAGGGHLVVCDRYQHRINYVGTCGTVDAGSDGSADAASD
jgi:hypothetical protein